MIMIMIMLYCFVIDRAV